MTLRILEQPEVLPRWAAGTPFVARMPVPSGLIRGISFDISGTTVATTAIRDDAPWTMLSDMSITLPLRRGDVVLRLSGQDFYLLSRYLTGQIRENVATGAAAAFNASFFLPFGPRNWGYHSRSMRAGAEVIVKGTWAAAVRYGTATTSITAGILRPTLHVESGVPENPARRALVFTGTLLNADSASRFPKVRLNKPEYAEGLFGVLYRQQDFSALADRVDGLVTRFTLHHSTMGELHDWFFAFGRQNGLEWAGIDSAEAIVASPRGLDGTALYVASPTFERFATLASAELALTYDAAETVPLGTTNVANAAGDAVHTTVIATMMPGG